MNKFPRIKFIIVGEETVGKNIMPYKDDKEYFDKLKKNNNSLKALDIGCGPDKMEGVTGLDIVKFADNIDIIHDLNITPWPVRSGEYDLIFCNHIIEHVEDVAAFFNEAARIIKPRGTIVIRTPHYSNVDSFSDPTHKRHLTLNSLNFLWERGHAVALFDLDERKLEFGKGLFAIIGKILANISIRQYEKYYCRLFPANTIYFRLKRPDNVI